MQRKRTECMRQVLEEPQSGGKHRTRPERASMRERTWPFEAPRTSASERARGQRPPHRVSHFEVRTVHRPCKRAALRRVQRDTAGERPNIGGRREPDLRHL